MSYEGVPLAQLIMLVGIFFLLVADRSRRVIIAKPLDQKPRKELYLIIGGEKIRLDELPYSSLVPFKKPGQYRVEVVEE